MCVCGGGGGGGEGVKYIVRMCGPNSPPFQRCQVYDKPPFSKKNYMTDPVFLSLNGPIFFLSFYFFLLILARSNFDHYARECNFGILKKKTKTKQKNKNKTKKQKNLSAVFLTK